MKVMVFPRIGEFDKAKKRLEQLKCEFKIITPSETCDDMVCPSLVFTQKVYSKLMTNANNEFIFSGCIDYIPPEEKFEVKTHSTVDDVFGSAYIMVFTACEADETKARIIAHLSKDIAEVFPYINAVDRKTAYNKNSKTLTFMEKHRLITLYNNRIGIAKSDGIEDVWRILSDLRKMVNDTNANKESITPSYDMRKKPPAIKIYTKLPRTNCGQCGKKSCMAFAISLHSGEGQPKRCTAIFESDFSHLLDDYLDICSFLGYSVSEMT